MENRLFDRAGEYRVAEAGPGNRAIRLANVRLTQDAENTCADSCSLCGTPFEWDRRTPLTCSVCRDMLRTLTNNRWFAALEREETKARRLGLMYGMGVDIQRRLGSSPMEILREEVRRALREKWDRIWGKKRETPWELYCRLGKIFKKNGMKAAAEEYMRVSGADRQEARRYIKEIKRLK